MKKKFLKILLKLVLGVFVFMATLSQLLGWAISEKLWVEKLWVTAASGGVFGAIGLGVGVVIGGIGLALGGGAIGIAGWLVFGVLGFGAGALGGSLWTIIQSPQDYNIDFFRLSLVLIAATTVTIASLMLTSRCGRWVRRYIKGKAELPQIEA